MAATAEKAFTDAEIIAETMGPDELAAVMQPINGDPAGKNFLSMRQLSADDIYRYLGEADAATRLIVDPEKNGIDLLPRRVLHAVMRQPSTRTGGSMVTAMIKLGGAAELISGMGSSAEAKGETLADSWEAFATQTDLLATRTPETYGPMFAAHIIMNAARRGALKRAVPVINLGDGPNEHPTQTIGDLYTMYKHCGTFDGLRLAIVGDHERYRAHHSLLVAAATLGMQVTTVESAAAPVPRSLVDMFGNKLTRTDDLDAAMENADVLYMGRNPDEYTGENGAEQERSQELAEDFRKWRVDAERLRLHLPPAAIGMHPRPRRTELHPSVDGDRRMKDVEQMAHMIPARMAIIALHFGKSISDSMHDIAK